MHIEDLEKFLVIANTENMQRAASELDSSPSVLSKSLKRLESSLDVQLFDRVGKHIRLNPAGELLRGKAASLVAQAKQTKAEFAGLSASQQYRIAGPSILMFRWASVISRYLMAKQPQAVLRFDAVYEDEALAQVINGSADLALITTAIAPQLPDGLHVRELGEVTMQVAAAANHPLLKDKAPGDNEVSIHEMLEYPFVTPSISPYCGESRGVGCDGWQNKVFPRRMQMITNDYGVMSQLIRSGQALGYLPDYWLREWSLTRIRATDCPYHCVEKLLLVSWQKELIDNFVSH